MKSADETKRHINSFLILTITLVVLLTLGAALLFGQATNEKSEWKPLEDAMGRSGKLQPGDVFKFGMPRKDLQVTVNGVQVKPGLALGSWAAFKKMGEEAMVMGDLVLTTDEVEPVMLKLQQEGIEQTALHNHLLGGGFGAAGLLGLPGLEGSYVLGASGTRSVPTLTQARYTGPALGRGRKCN